MNEADPTAAAREIMKQQAREAGQGIVERWHNHPSSGPCDSRCGAGGIEWNGRGLVIDHFTAQNAAITPDTTPRRTA